MSREKFSGVNLVDSEQTDEGIRYRYSVRTTGVNHERREQRAKRKAEADARARTVALPNQIEEVDVTVGAASTSDPAFTIFRVTALVKKAF